MAVAAHARVGRQARGVVGHPRLDHPGPELFAQVQREVGEPHPVGQRPCAAHGVGRAARALPVVLGVTPQLERHGHDLALRAQRGHRRVDPPAHGHERPLGAGATRALSAPPRRALGRARRRRGRRRAASRAEPAELGGGLRAAHAGGVEQRRAADELDRRAGRGDGRAAPAASKPASTTRSPSTATLRRTRSPHAAPPAAPSRAPGGAWPRPRGWIRWSAKRSSGISHLSVCANSPPARGPCGR